MAVEKLNAVGMVNNESKELAQLRSELAQKERENKALKEKSRRDELALAVEEAVLNERARYRENGERNHNGKRGRDDDRDGGGDRGRERQGDIKCCVCNKIGHMNMKRDCTSKVQLPWCGFCRSSEHDPDGCQRLKDSVCSQCNKNGHTMAFHRVRHCRKCNKEHQAWTGAEGQRCRFTRRGLVWSRCAPWEKV